MAESVPSGAEANQIKNVLERAIKDAEFCRQLLDDPDIALAGYVLSDVQLLLLRSLDEEDLAKLTPEYLEEYFAEDSAVDITEHARIVQQGHEAYDAEHRDDERGRPR